MASRSPNRLSKSEGNWALVSDHTVKVDGLWTGGRWALYYPDIPAHKSSEGSIPAGQNQAYMDGSAEWVDARRLIDIGNWFGDFTHQIYWHQQDLGGWVPPENAYAVEGPR